MQLARWFGPSAFAYAWACTIAIAQNPVPLADPVEKQLLPTGLSRLPVAMDAELGYVFSADDGVQVIHLIGDFSLRFGGIEGSDLGSREAVIWIAQRNQDSVSYQHLNVWLWRDAYVRGSSGALTEAPAIFVTINTVGKLTVNLDEVAHQSSETSTVYSQGNAVRNTFAKSEQVDISEDVALRVFNLGGLRRDTKSPSPRPVIEFRSDGELIGSISQDGRQVMTVTGGLFLSRGTPGKDDYLSIRADSAVVFMPSSANDIPPGEPQKAGLGATPTITTRNKAQQRRDDPNRQFLNAGIGDIEVESVYLEGDVLMTEASTTIRASKLYYDLLKDRALILDAVVRTTVVPRGLPLVIRAGKVRQISRNRFTAEDAMLTTSEFYKPHYHVGAKYIELRDLSPADNAQPAAGIQRGQFRIQHATLNVGGTPILYWPLIQGRVAAGETTLQSVRTGFSGDFGTELETNWDFFSLLGYETPDGFDSTLSLDYFSERGPAIGVDVTYQRDDYFGTIRTYFMSDNDKDNLGREREVTSVRDVRGRALVRHRQYLPDDWQLTVELSYISDKGFLEEFFEPEFDRDKEQETLLHLKRQRDNWAYTILIQGRILDFETQTERLPEIAYHRIGQPIGGGATWFTENRFGVVRFRPADQDLFDLFRDGRTVSSGSVTRIDSRQEITLPLDLGSIRLVPFAALRGTAWGDSVDQGGLVRVLGTYGVRAGMYFSRVYPHARSNLLDIEGVRHIIKPTLTAWISHTNRDPHELFPFDETVEGLSEVDGVELAVRQRWQTKRGSAQQPRTVDFLTVDAKVGVFNDAEGDDITNGFVSFSRPENSIARNYFDGSVVWRVNDRTALLSEMNYDLNDGEIDILNVSLTVDRSPRLSYLLGYRFIEESNSNLFAFDMNYRLTEKHTLAVRELFDMARGETLDFTVALIRKLPRWYSAISFALDEAENDFGVSFSLWPEGVPGAALGSRRFTGVTNVSRLRGN